MSLNLSQDQVYTILQDMACHVLGAEDSETRRAFLEKIAAELWVVAQTPVQPEDEPGFLL